MREKRDQRTLIIVSLLVIVFIMVVGFAAFATNLTINGTANISTNWCVGFDNTKTTAYEITKGKSTGTNPSATMEYDGTACSTNYVPIANLGAVFYQPGDKIEYTLTIANKGSVDAAIESIKVNGSSVTSNQTITDGNIIWKVYMPESTTLASNATTTMKVSAEFQNTTDISNLTTGGSSSLTVGINVVQGTSGMAITPAAQTVYAWNTTDVTIGTSTINDLASTKTANPYYTSASDVMSASGYTFFNKYTVVNDTITEGYTCQTFGISGLEPVCLKMSTDGSGYDAGGNHTGNVGILKALQSNSKFTGSCSLDSYSCCSTSDLSIQAYSDGGVDSGGVSAYCDVDSRNGAAGCHE